MPLFFAFSSDFVIVVRSGVGRCLFVQFEQISEIKNTVRASWQSVECAVRVQSVFNLAEVDVYENAVIDHFLALVYSLCSVEEVVVISLEERLLSVD